jgi:predicted Zn-dependent peptidase
MSKLNFVLLLLLGAATTNAQKVAFTEYDLKNGLHVILHQDKTAPVVAVSVMYHVGSKDEKTDRTGLHTSLSTCCLKEVRISKEANS